MPNSFPLLLSKPNIENLYFLNHIQDGDVTGNPDLNEKIRINPLTKLLGAYCSSLSKEVSLVSLVTSSDSPSNGDVIPFEKSLFSGAVLSWSSTSESSLDSPF